jgi:hypothetical protein
MWDVVREIISGEDASVNPDSTKLKIVEKGEDAPLTQHEGRDNGGLLELNIDALDRDQRNRIESRFERTFDHQEGLFEAETNEDVRVAEAGVTDEQIQSIISFYQGYLDESDTDLLRRGFYLRKAWESDESYTSRREMSRRRDELAAQFGHEAYTITNLCSSGYFDEDGYITHLFKELNDPDVAETVRIFETIAQDEPFTVFIGGYDNPPEIKAETVQKIKKADTYPFNIEFVDVRAQGGKNRSKLETVWMEIQREADRLRFEGDIDDRESVLRIYPDSVEGI